MNRKNLLFIKGDIADIPFLDSIIDYVVCDQVLMHTENPEKQLKELVRILKKESKLLVMFMQRKRFRESY
jgi:ubiquinone/menaquinone biosynthesis C-methylase UbiE